MFKRSYYLIFETQNLDLSILLNDITVVKHQNTNDKIQLDQWLKPGFNKLLLQFNKLEKAAPQVSAATFIVRGNLYSIGLNGDQTKKIIANFKWSNKNTDKLLPFQDQFEFMVE